MATTKKPLKRVKLAPKNAPVSKKVVAKKATPVKKGVPVKKVPPVKKVAPVKKAVPVKKAAPAKKTLVAKIIPLKKVSTVKKDSTAKKFVTVKPILKKAVAPIKNVAAPIKKVALPSKKPAVTKKNIAIQPKQDAKKTKKIEPKTVVRESKKNLTTKLIKPVANPPVKKAVVLKVVPKNEKPVKKSPSITPKAAKEAVPKKAIIVPEKKSVPQPAKNTTTKPVASKIPAKPSKPVVIPKTSTDKKVDYEPDFLKSVLDSPTFTPATPTMRYSDKELNEFRELINKKLDAAKKELAYLQGLITRKDEMGGDETDNRYMTMEDGGMSMEREQLSQMASRQITFIDHLEKAIMRIENKTYGICRVTGKLIDKARLRAVPHATLSMEAKLGIVK